MDNIKVMATLNDVEAAKQILQQQNLVGQPTSPSHTSIQQKPFKNQPFENITSQQGIEQPLQPVQEANTLQKERKRGKRGGDPLKKFLRTQKFFYAQKCKRYLNKDMVNQQRIEQPSPSQTSIQQKSFENAMSQQGIEQPLQPVQEANTPQKDRKCGKRGGDPFKRFIHNQKFFYTQKYNHYRNMKIMATNLVKLVTALDMKTAKKPADNKKIT